ncbi:MAG: hypothetical protein Q9165_002399 [Trypethelium subeluteriae]
MRASESGQPRLELLWGDVAAWAIIVRKSEADRPERPNLILPITKSSVIVKTPSQIRGAKRKRFFQHTDFSSANFILTTQLALQFQDTAYLLDDRPPITSVLLTGAATPPDNLFDPVPYDSTILSEESRSGAGGDGQGQKSSGGLVNGEVKTEPGTMPGVLIMDQNGDDRIRKIKDGSNNSTSDVKVEEGKPLTNGVKAAPQFDGVSEMMETGSAPQMALTNGSSSQVAGQVTIPDSLVESWNQLPPELQHFEESYLPLSTLIERVAQQCYNGLEDVIQQMAEKPKDEAQQSGAPIVNGIGHHNGTNAGSQLSKEDLRKRTLLMTFARDQRDKLIKLMVLTQWSRQIGDITKLIDIFNWLLSQMRTHEEAARWTGQIRLNMLGEKQSNPDIRTALEVLTSGKASWMPELNYIPRKPLSPQELLKTLKNLNALLAIRLNLHEEQPRHFRYSHITNGRATWIVPQEFEVDLSIIDEDPESQFFFIDIRLLFSPAPEIPDFFRSRLELRINDALQSRGLSGCYDTLHDLVLTHKITILKQQAFELMRRRWSENLYVDSIHRSLIVQYWTDLSGPKSWIEIGVASGRKRQGESGWRERPIPHIAIRWFRDGKEVQDINLLRAINLTQLSMESILETVVKLHTLDFLRRIQDGLTPKDGSTSSSTGSLIRPKTSSDSPTYKAQLGATGTAFTLAVERVTGNLAIQPLTIWSSRIQHGVNQHKNRSTEAFRGIKDLLFLDLQTQIEKLADRKGWSIVKNLNLTQENVKAGFKQDVSRLSIFRPAGWSQDWAFVATISFSGDTWWIANIDETVNGRTITEATCIAGPSDRPHSRETLAQLERFAVALISFHVTHRELDRGHIENYLESEFAPSSTSSPLARPILHVQVSSLLRLRRKQSHWIEWLHLTHAGLERVDSRVVHLIRGKISSPHCTSLAALLTHTHDHAVAFSTAGAFALFLRSPFGKAFMSPLQKRTRSIERLSTIASVLRKRRFRYEKLSLNEVVFTYPSDIKPLDQAPPPFSDEDDDEWYTNTTNPDSTGLLRAGIVFTDGEEQSLSLRLAPTNPHRRIRAFLARILSKSRTGRSFESFVAALHMTLPLMRAFDTIEDIDEPGWEPAIIHPRSLESYRVDYEHPRVSFDVNLNHHGDLLRWHVTEVAGNESTEALKKGLKELFELNGESGGEARAGKKRKRRDGEEEEGEESSGGPLWWGMRTGLIATVAGVEDAITRLDEVVRESVQGGGNASAATVGANASTIGASTGGAAAAAKPSQNSQTGRQVPVAKGPGIGVNAGAPKIKQEKKNDVIELD